MSPTAFQSPASVVRVLTGQTIAKTPRRTPHERARLAAEWKVGTLKIEPTVKLASEVFGVSEQLVRQAIAEVQHCAVQNGAVLNGTPVMPPNPIESAWWIGLSESERDAFVAAHLDSIWRSFERLTG
jgi:hypothetical protein